ncbi:MAG: RagB/SusD family nutrient uptake outer membrane protein [Tidjanibacter sp.]|nr:RagB/SusD family nutrient uptake outer membrane protein [Tidjanibacter sp.]
MKKTIVYIALSAIVALGTTSCNMEFFPYDSLEISNGIKTYQDAASYRVSIYSPLKSFVGSLRETVEDTRSDLFNAKADFGNYYGRWHSWQNDITDTEASSVWYNDYAIIGNVNFAIDSYTDLIDNAEALGISDEEVVKIETFRGEAYMVRAMAYLDLATKFCAAYDEAKADEPASGVPLPTKYEPTSDAASYPGRTTLNETYTRILDDIADAELAIETLGAQNSAYFTKDAVLALRARVYLYMGQWDLAVEDALAVINGNRYALASTPEAIRMMWDGDTSSENIMRIAKNNKDQGGTTGGYYYINDQNKGDGTTPNPQYLPTKTLLDMYDKTNDMRYPVYFETHNVKAGYEKADMVVFYKFKGNPSLRTDARWNYVHMGKPFRLAELYLIMAECLVELEDEDGATFYLNELRKARITGFDSKKTYGSLDALRQEVRNERVKELVGEGFRVHDLKRWGLGMTRGVSQNASMTHSAYDKVSVEKGNFRFLWPIPKSEMDANPQFKGQQNAGF